MKQATTHPLYELLSALEAAHVHFTLGRYRSDTILVSITLVGERLEVDVYADGQMAVTRFTGSEATEGAMGLVYERLERQPV